jgi:hypothetical protein
MRSESDKPAGNGGWIHRLKDAPAGREFVRRQPPPPQRHLNPDDIGREWARWADQTTDAHVNSLADALGVKALALRDVGACWAWPHDAWAFPMLDGAGEFCGMRLRSEDGTKRALRGSRHGVFLPSTRPESDTAVVCEGPTDLSAALSLGFWGIGRPSCLGAVADVKTTCARMGITKLLVIADNDGPGLRGAAKLIEEARMTAKLVVLPAKDLRAWVASGGGRSAVDACIDNAKWRVF